MPNHAAATTFASLGAVCWSVQLIPQIYMNHKRRCTEGFSGLMMMLWVSAGVPLGIYNVVQDLNIGLQIQPQLFMFFALICTVQTYHYRLEWTYTKSFIIILCVGILLAGLEVAGIELLRLGIRNGVRWPITLIGVISAVLINIGLVPQYWEIYKRNAVIGVSYAFLSIDCAGAVFSFISLPFDEWDILAAISYGLLIVEEVGIFVLGVAFWTRDRKKNSRVTEKGDGTTQDEITVVEEDTHARHSSHEKRQGKDMDNNGATNDAGILDRV
ncbi:Uncharacterized protein C2E12.03c [Taphrina deformans PYCC 5710]|uniref:Uncharacterized protein C2E12.03c n=1 Tax=Taphrina deformans (strain PYCC 5710 / ATCC 11124 / CBS 356.35 / IMI 108563 / JCM 9778 / NBRC 8474) TaxID=1097556 RepID=R4XAQ2_TAPDE|nr:Uncharacterized protein C2E12.03c [Taphrina deformans PYCC 5710]|eukprot:CCG82929.1 Uncharacterized protein C2E12.03c [Taphrina deformans PYCC 5710]